MIECDSSPCQHGGTCDESPSGAGYECLCVDGYIGNDCEISEYIHYISGGALWIGDRMEASSFSIERHLT